VGASAQRELALQAEVQQLRARIAELENDRQSAVEQAKEQSGKRTEDALPESEATYRTLFANMAEEVHFWKLVRDEEGRIQTWTLVDANSPALKTWGKDLAAIRGKTTDEIFGPGATDHYMPMVRKIMAEGLPHSFEDYFFHLDKYFRFTSVPLGDYFITTGADITEIRKAQEALRKSEAKIRAAFKALAEGVIFLNREGKIEEANDAVETVTGYGREALAAATLESWSLAVRADGTPFPVRELPAVVALRTGKAVRNVELAVRKPDGTLAWMLVNAQPVRDEQGILLGAVASLFDLSELRLAEEVLRQSEAQFRTLANAIPQLCWMANSDGWIFWYNQRWYDYTGVTAEKTRGWGWQSVHDPAVLPQVLERWKGSLATGEPFDMVFPLRGADGVFRPFLTRVMPVKDTEGKVARWFGTNTDIGEQLKTERALRESEKRLAAEVVERTQSEKDLTADLAALTRIHALSTSLVGTGEPEPLLQEIMDAAVAIMQADRGTLQLLEEGSLRIVAHHGHRAAFLDFFAAAEGRASVCGEALKRGDRLIVEDVESSPIFAGTPSLPVLREAGVRAVQSTPLRSRGGEVLGILTTQWSVPHVPAEHDLWRMDLLVRQAADLIERSRAGAALRSLAQFPEENPNPVLRVRSDGSLEFANAAARTYLALGEAENPTLPAPLRTLVERAIGEQRPVETELTCEGGRTLWFLAAQPRGESYVNLYGRDSTERNRSEEALRVSEAHARRRLAEIEAIYDSAPIALAVLDHELRYVRLNRRLAEINGLPVAAHLGKSIREILPQAIVDQVEPVLRRVLESGEPLSSLEMSDGSRCLAVSATPLKDERANVIGISVAAEDITGRKRMEEQLRQRMEEIQTVMEVAPVAIWVAHDPQCDRITGNRMANAFYEAEKEENVSANVTEARRFFQQGRELTAAELPMQAAAAANQDIRGSDLEVLLPSGHRLHMLGHASPLRDADGRVRGCVGTFLDITERRRAEEALRTSEKQLQEIIDGSPGVVFVKDLEGRFITVNRTFERLLAIAGDEIRGKTDFDIMTRERAESYREHDRRVAESGLPIQIEEVADLADGRPHVLLATKFPLRDAAGKVYAVCSISTDITERKQAEEHLRQAQKLESLGLLAGGVAHDFNNLLVGVIGSASLAQEMLPADHPAADLVRGIIKTGEQAAHLTRQMLAYSGRGKFLQEPLQLAAAIPEMVGLVQPSISKKIALHLGLDPDVPYIEADRGQIQQVFMNLVLNAAEAIGSHDGLIVVSAGRQVVDDAYLRLNPEAADLPPGPYVFLEVRDTGCGMDGATKGRIFDPFFSTKFLGRGLGLAAVAGIVRGHKGAIVVRSTPGKGSSFTVLFPPAADPVEQSQVAASRRTLEGSGVVLVVDDEHIVREMAKRALERYGYTVLLADSGMAAIDLFKRHPAEIAMVILDLSMPNMSGEEVLPELKKIRPAAKVIISSGYSEAETMNLFAGQQVAGFIQKPYTAMGIAEKVKRAME
jgi:PAS domain S-box-containing protein